MASGFKLDRQLCYETSTVSSSYLTGSTNELPHNARNYADGTNLESGILCGGMPMGCSHNFEDGSSVGWMIHLGQALNVKSD